MNTRPEIQFVIHAGDVTEFGADSEIETAKNVMDRLSKPYYIVPGNHDAKWSESGCNTFNKVFGGSDFAFEKGGILFCGTGSGPNMRMGMAQVPRESMVWLDSLIKATPADKPVIYVNHNPVEKSLSNWDQVYDILKRGNLVLTMGGHWHTNNYRTYDGVPAVIGRSTLAHTPKIRRRRVQYRENSALHTRDKDIQPSGRRWKQPPSRGVRSHWPISTVTRPQSRPDYSLNDKYPNAKVVWEKQDNSDIGSGFAFERQTYFLRYGFRCYKGNIGRRRS